MNDEYQSMAANAICHAAAMAGETWRMVAHSYERPSVLFKPKLSRDGNAWSALFGDDLQVGVAGFGESPAAAMLAFDEAWSAPIKVRSPIMSLSGTKITTYYQNVGGQMHRVDDSTEDDNRYVEAPVHNAIRDTIKAEWAESYELAIQQRDAAVAEMADVRKRLESIRHRADSEWAAQVARKDGALREIQRIGTLHKDPYVPGQRFAEIATEALTPTTSQSEGQS